MRNSAPMQLEVARLHPPEFIRTKPGEMQGMFQLVGPQGVQMRMLSSGHDREYNWEHVSVTVRAPRCPTWEEMCFVKNLFWAEDEVVMQLHPAAHEYINEHPHCLHLWKPIGATIPTPPTILIGAS